MSVHYQNQLLAFFSSVYERNFLLGGETKNSVKFNILANKLDLIRPLLEKSTKLTVTNLLKLMQLCNAQGPFGQTQLHILQAIKNNPTFAELKSLEIPFLPKGADEKVFLETLCDILLYHPNCTSVIFNDTGWFNTHQSQLAGLVQILENNRRSKDAYEKTHKAYIKALHDFEEQQQGSQVSQLLKEAWQLALEVQELHHHPQAKSLLDFNNILFLKFYCRSNQFQEAINWLKEHLKDNCLAYLIVGEAHFKIQVTNEKPDQRYERLLKAVIFLHSAQMLLNFAPISIGILNKEQCHIFK